jgi:hypothetical protein
VFDTAGIHCEGLLREEACRKSGSRLLKFGEGWKARLRDGQLYRAEGSLARYNQGRLPQTEAELTTALENVLADLRGIAEIGEWWFDRLDLARDVAEPTGPLVRACRLWRFSDIRKSAEVADDDSSIRWGNRRTQIQVRIYDAAKRHRLPGPLTRLEVSLNRRQVVQRGLHRDVPWAILEATFAEFVALLPDACPALPTGKLTDGQIVARIGQLHGAEVAQTLLELLQQSRSRPTIRKIRRQFAAGIPEPLLKSPRAAFTLPSLFIGKNLSTTLLLDASTSG